MAKYTTTKFVEAALLNKNTRMPTSKRIDLPFGAIIQDPREDGDQLQFLYLGEWYGTKLEDIQGYYHPIAAKPVAAGASDDAGVTPAQPAPEKILEFRPVKSNLAIKRAKVPGGWLVALGESLTFVPDPGHKWDGASA